MNNTKYHTALSAKRCNQQSGEAVTNDRQPTAGAQVRTRGYKQCATLLGLLNENTSIGIPALTADVFS